MPATRATLNDSLNPSRCARPRSASCAAFRPRHLSRKGTTHQRQSACRPCTDRSVAARSLVASRCAGRPADSDCGCRWLGLTGLQRRPCATLPADVPLVSDQFHRASSGYRTFHPYRCTVESLALSISALFFPSEYPTAPRTHIAITIRVPYFFITFIKASPIYRHRASLFQCKLKKVNGRPQKQDRRPLITSFGVANTTRYRASLRPRPRCSRSCRSRSQQQPRLRADCHQIRYPFLPELTLS